MEGITMTCMITCSRCQAGFDLDEGGSGAIYMRPLGEIPLCANCIDEIVFEHLEREEEA
jgi:hypothetical protein